MTVRTSFAEHRHLDPIPPVVARHLRRIDLAQGRIDRLASDAPFVAAALARRSRIESVIASNELEGVRTERHRAERLIEAAVEPETGDEHEIAGYRAALDDVIAHPTEQLTPARLLSWHRELFRYAGPEVAGRFKSVDNRVTNPDGSDRFLTVSAGSAGAATLALIGHCEAALSEEVTHPLVVIGAFVLDFLVIHPFEDGNGRTARIATNAMMSRSGYTVGRYLSIERQLDDHRNAYYESLHRSTVGWHESQHSLWPWVEFFTGLVADAYAIVVTRLETTSVGENRDLVFVWLRTRAPTTFKFGDAIQELAGVPRGTVRSALDEARHRGAVELRGTGRGAHWVIVNRSAVESAAQTIA